ncbi:hypothetical protein ACQUQU_15690 [Thalassolituus sp. LLYu03]|uniref:hypothetical protein n=1 Tax=Thalassolituus sp. LLYu03 TaxID=3421656 RepID=UPI003D29FBA5
MKISQGDVSLSGQQQHQLDLARITGQAVAVNAGNDADRDSDSSSDTQASIRLSLSRQSSESRSVNSQSLVTGACGQQQQLASSSLASQLMQSLTEWDYSVSAVSPGATSAGLGVDVTVTSVLRLEESSYLGFEAGGQVQTADGRSIDFLLALEFSRHTRVEQLNAFSGRLNLIDPLMINLAGGSVELTDQSFDFDLNQDGSREAIARPASGSGYLVFDRNGNGITDDGSELFGPQSGNGFAELAQYDDDGNGWIDENDAIFARLGVLQVTDDGAMTRTAAEAGLGALYLGSVAADYDLRNDGGEVLGVIRGSGVALAESGQALLLQEVHLAAPAPAAAVYTHADGTIQGDTGAMTIDSALGFFQFSNELLDSRDAQTHVRLRRNINDAPFPVLVASASPLSRSETLVSDSVYRLSESQRNQLQQWVSSAVREFNPQLRLRGSDAPVYNPIPDPVRAVPLNLADALEATTQSANNQLSALRATIEELKHLRRQQQEQGQQVALYQAIGRLPN